jgi:hypothetical protein
LDAANTTAIQSRCFFAAFYPGSYGAPDEAAEPLFPSQVENPDESRSYNDSTTTIQLQEAGDGYCHRYGVSRLGNLVLDMSATAIRSDTILCLNGKPTGSPLKAVLH